MIKGTMLILSPREIPKDIGVRIKNEERRSLSYFPVVLFRGATGSLDPRVGENVNPAVFSLSITTWAKSEYSEGNLVTSLKASLTPTKFVPILNELVVSRKSQQSVS